jgi:hypothetical protein
MIVVRNVFQLFGKAREAVAVMKDGIVFRIWRRKVLHGC